MGDADHDGRDGHREHAGADRPTQAIPHLMSYEIETKRGWRWRWFLTTDTQAEAERITELLGRWCAESGGKVRIRETSSPGGAVTPVGSQGSNPAMRPDDLSRESANG